MCVRLCRPFFTCEQWHLCHRISAPVQFTKEDLCNSGRKKPICSSDFLFFFLMKGHELQKNKHVFGHPKEGFSVSSLCICPYQMWNTSFFFPTSSVLDLCIILGKQWRVCQNIPAMCSLCARPLQTHQPIQVCSRTKSGLARGWMFICACSDGKPLLCVCICILP